ncbi:MAG TPA: hypothetical protein EYQ53_05235 [Candidatus Poseidoniales archaeon]|nr:MAG: hypothetical protein CXT69_02205 [Euryarchaeota archaeon]HIG03766.1 hypothetical protein [Candidatus Poseidoniales archaeon]HIK78701.1 hypothetical protein [Candidatus Poseidoniales archaeon]
MRKSVLILVSFMVLSLSSISALAQDDIPQPGWDIGWNEDFEDITWLMDTDGEVMVEFWVDNQDPLPIDINIAWEADLDADLDISESINIAAQSNKTFEVTITNVTVIEHLANSTGNVRITATRASPIDGSDVTLDAKVIEGDFEIPRIADLDVELIYLGFPVSAGTTAMMEVVLTNNGNMRDKAVSPTIVAQGCPQLSLDGLSEVENTVVNSVHDGNQINTVTVEVSISPASSHPSKECTIELAIVSEGGGGTSITTQFVDIEAVNSNSDDGGDDDDSSSNGGVDDNGGDGSFIKESMPATSLFATTALIVVVAIIIRRDE